MILDSGIATFIRPSDEETTDNLLDAEGNAYLRSWYGTSTVGIHRFYEARQAGQRIDKLIRIPRPTERDMVWADDLCMLGGSEQIFRVAQMQEVTDEESGESVLDISLERMSGIWQ